MKKTLLLGVDGEAKDLFINKGKAGLYFEPENDSDLAEKVLYLNSNRDEMELLGQNGREYVDTFFNRNKIAKDFFSVLNKI